MSFDLIPTLGQEALRRMWLPETTLTGANGTESVDALFMFILWISIISFIGLMGAMFWFVWKYRRGTGNYQVSAAHNTPMELAWSIGPLIPLVAIFFWGFHGYIGRLAAPVDAEEIVVRAFQWNWDVTYDNGGESRFTADAGRVRTGDNAVPQIPVPAGKPVQLRMYSTDVIHAFFIPDFRSKMDVMPNRYRTFWFQTGDMASYAPTIEAWKAEHGADAEWPGHLVYCAEYCGKEHSEMLAYIKPMDPADYAAFKASSIRPQGTPVEMGEYLWKKHCRSCHTVDGSPNTGPTWLNLFGYERQLADGSSVVADENYIVESINYPATKIAAGYPNQMNSFAGILKPEEYEAIIAYMKSLSDRGGAPAGGAEQEGGEEAAPEAGAAPAEGDMSSGG